jgi:EAL domain-containing protein (putative c-di-GMP-specific phosphodiesterase class I)/GGDEF domain-containing protein
MKNPIKGLELAKQPARLKVLHNLGILDTEPEPRFDRITALVADVLQMPIALISFVDSDRQWFKSICGFKEHETNISESLCAYAINEPELLVIENALEDPRFNDHPAITGDMAIRFYAGAVLRARSGHPLGTLCIIDFKPRTLDVAQRRQLPSFARLVESEIWEDIADIQARAQSRLADHIDPLTGFFSLDEFSHRYQQCLQHVKDSKSEWSFGSLLLIKLPQLDFAYRVKGLDAYLQLVLPVAKSIARLFINSDVFFGRYERDGFLVFVPPSEVSTAALPSLVRNRLRQDPDITSLLEETSIHCSVAPALSDLDQSLHCCLFALDSIRDDNGLVCNSFTAADGLRLKRESDIGLKLVEALDNAAIWLFFQPKADVASGEISGMEALLRWQDDELGKVSPQEIVKAAEQLDKTTMLDYWVIRSSIAQIAAWQARGLGVVPVSVNLSNESLLDASLIDRISVALGYYNVRSSLLNIEVLETALFNDIDTIAPLMNKLVDAGIALSLDDFGMEYSSLRYLQLLPVTTVKIDRSFISQVTASSDAAMLVKGIIGIAHGLGMATVAEGVETQEQFDIIKQFGCDSIQGNYFSVALAQQDVAKLLELKATA